MKDAGDPIFIRPRMLPRRWGRGDLGTWCPAAARPEAPVGEIWLAHPNNRTSADEHLGMLLSADPEAMLGDLGRAPPSLRLVLTSEPTDALYPEGPVSLWRILESPLDGVVRIDGTKKPRQAQWRRGDLIRTTDRVGLALGADVVALEARASFSPTNACGPELTKLSEVKTRAGRGTWLRDSALSVEAWTLPAESQIEPDGETCHVMVALTEGVALDGRALAKGEAVFIPANGRVAQLTGRGGQILVAYPDLLPTRIWRAPRYDPAARAAQQRELATHDREAIGMPRAA